ncbi:hypothetical protein JW851_00435 [Candidatus Woesearchaeota archaeon]|nr:hypothetical protein [Candidatus Woesearchaeota archaeon]
MKDIVMPDNNERDFIVMAKKLGFNELVFLYNSKNQFYRGKSDIKISNALITNEKRVQKDFLTFVKNPDDARFAFEKSKPNCVFDLELQKKDFIHQRGSGLNHIMAKLANQNSINIGFSFSSILNASPIQRSRIIGRIKQNIKLCRKYKVKTVIASFAVNPFDMRSFNDLISFFTVLGMHPKEAKDSLNCSFKKKSIVELA